MRIATLLSAIGTASALTISEINGNQYLSPYDGEAVTDVTGLVTAKGSYGFYIRSTTPDDDDATSESIYVYGSDAVDSVTVGDIISLDGTVQEYRSSTDYLYLTEISSPTNIAVQSSGNEVTALVIGIDTLAPPTEQFSSLDEGDIFAVPNAVTTISEANPELDPTLYGMDFWESLTGELVTVTNPVAIAQPNAFGDTWVYGDWPVTGLNSHGGLTMTDKDANPETILIGSPLDGTDNPDDTKMGDILEEITGIVTYAYGFYNILPVTALEVATSADKTITPTTLLSSGNCTGITVGDYNAENLTPTSDHLPDVADQIVNYLMTPDIIFLQEVQDNNGNTDDDVVNANLTLSTLAAAIEDISGVVYDFVNVDPVDDEDGGEPGGNIRVAYLYRPDVVELYKPNAGGSLDATEVIDGPEISFNPGRIDPTNDAWSSSRKPVVAMWRPLTGNQQTFFTVNVHFSSKGGSTSLHGDARPPENGALDSRTLQAEVTGSFIGEILAQDSLARVIAAGDFNEFTFVQPMTNFVELSGMVDVDEVVGMDEVERYTYRYDMNSQALDHIYVSPALQGSKSQVEHLHLSTWDTYDDRVSDHDPSVAKFNLCGC